ISCTFRMSMPYSSAPRRKVRNSPPAAAAARSASCWATWVAPVIMFMVFLSKRCDGGQKVSQSPSGAVEPEGASVDGGAGRGSGCGDLADDVGHTLHRADDLLHRLAGVADEPRAGFDPLDARADQALDLFGRFGRAAREVAHFAGDHRKAAALLAGTRGFDRS